MTAPVPPIEIVLTPRPLERVESEIAVAGFFQDERPLRGGAARADWRLCGGLSRRIECGDLSGKSGEAVLIGCGRALRAPRLLLLGLGDRSTYDRLRVGDEFRLALERCRRLRLGHVGLAPLGVAPDDVPRHAEVLVAALREAWVAGDGADSGEGADPSGAAWPPGSFRLELCVPRSELAGVRRALVEALEAASLDQVRVTADESATAPR